MELGRSLEQQMAREEQLEVYKKTLSIEPEFDYDAPVSGVNTIYSKVHRPASANTWTDDFGDEFALTWMGQMIEGEYNDSAHYNRKSDSNYNPYDKDNILGYEQYADFDRSTYYYSGRANV